MSNQYNDISLKIAQLKSDLSSIEKVQANTVRNIPGSAGVPGEINGTASQTLKNINNTYSDGISIATRLAGQLENSGMSSKTATTFMNSVVSPSINYKTSLTAETVNSIEGSETLVRIKSDKNSTPAEQIKRSRDRLIGDEDLNYEGISFPSDLDEEAHTKMQLQFYTYDRSSPRAAGQLNPSISLYLPLPENFQVDFGVSYDVVDTGFTGTVKNALTNVATSVGNNEAELSAKIGKALSEVGRSTVEGSVRAGYATLDGAEATLGGLVGGAAGAAGEIQKALGQVPNPHASVFFKGMPLRQFSWSWKLVPKNERDSQTLQAMLSIIKTMMLPERNGDMLRYPDMVQPKVITQGDTPYSKYSKCFIENFSINYTGEGSSSFFRNGHPVSVVINLQLRENELLTRDKLV